MAVLASVVPYTLELAAMRRAPRRVFGILLSLEPAVAALAGLVLLGQRVPPAAAAAIALVILARAGATMGARPPVTATDGAEAAALDDSPERVRALPVPPLDQLAAADASAFADTGGVGRHASPGSTTNV